MCLMDRLQSNQEACLLETVPWQDDFDPKGSQSELDPGL